MNWRQYTQQDPLVRMTVLLAFVFLLVAGLYYASGLLIPISYAALLAMLMLPLNKRLEQLGVPRVIAIGMCVLAIVLVIAGTITLLSSQMVSLARDLPGLRSALEIKLSDLYAWIERMTDITPKKQTEYLRSLSSSFFSSAGSVFRQFWGATTNIVADLGLLIIYTFLFMFYRSKFQRFVLQLMPDDNHAKVNGILTQITQVTEQFLAGKFIVTVILAVLNTAALMIIGVQQAIFFGVLAAILNWIPYIGTFLGGVFPVMMALLTRDSLGPAIAVAASFSFNQFIDNNFLTPYIIGSRVNINALFTILAIIVGGMLWGASGMILSVPLLAIARIVFDQIDSLRPYGELIGDDKGDSKTSPPKLFRKAKEPADSPEKRVEA